MWTRSLLKSNAKQALGGRYWRSFLLCLLLSLLGIGVVSPSVAAQYKYDSEFISSICHPEVWTGNNPGTDFSTSWEGFSPVLSTALIAVLILFFVMLLIALCWSFFLAFPLTVGRNRYFMESRQSPTPLRSALTVFRTPYLNLVKVMALTMLKIALGSLIIIPGIYWQYCYRQVPFLLAENPYMPVGRAMELSRQMMDGEKWKSFVLDISFIGWIILCVLSFGLGYLFLEPYMQATYAELYAALRSKAFETGLADSSELGGFVRHADNPSLF